MMGKKKRRIFTPSEEQYQEMMLGNMFEFMGIQVRKKKLNKWHVWNIYTRHRAVIHAVFYNTPHGYSRSYVYRPQGGDMFGPYDTVSDAIRTHYDLDIDDLDNNDIPF